MNLQQHEAAIERLVRLFEQLSRADIGHLGQCYAPDARFKDPFNEVQGRVAIEQIFRHMFESLHEPRFVVTSRMLQGQDCFLTWDFRFRFKRFKVEEVQTIRGATQLHLDESGLVRWHRDYWDAAEELYEKLPLVGGLMRWLKARANA